MRRGLIFSGGGTSLPQMLALAREAEQAGMDSIYVTEAWRSGFVCLAAIAMLWSRLPMCHLPK